MENITEVDMKEKSGMKADGNLTADSLTQLNKIMEEIVARIKKLGELQDKNDYENNTLTDEQSVRTNSRRWRYIAFLVGIIEYLDKNIAGATSGEFERWKTEKSRILERSDESEIIKLLETIHVPKPELIKALEEALEIAILYERAIKTSESQAESEQIASLRAKIIAVMTKVTSISSNEKEEEIFRQKAIASLKDVNGLITESESNFLAGCRKDVKSWPGYRGSVFFYGNRVKEYLYGFAQPDSGNKIRKGIVSEFKDATLEKEILQNDAIKNLITYREQIILFGILYILVSRLIKQDEWICISTKQEIFRELSVLLPNPALVTEDYVNEILNKRFSRYLEGNNLRMPFLGNKGFFRNLEMGEDYVGRVIRRELGNHVFANELLRVVKKAGEEPLVFAQEFKKLDAILISPAAQVKVINTAMNELSRILLGRILKLHVRERSDVKKIENEVAALIRNAMADNYRIVRKIAEKVREKKKALETETFDLLGEFKNNKEERLFEIANFIGSYERAIRQLDIRNVRAELKAKITLLLSSVQELQKLGSEASALANPASIDRSWVGQVYGLFSEAHGPASKREYAKFGCMELIGELKNVSSDIMPKINELIADADALTKRYEELLKLADDIKTKLKIETKEGSEGRIIKIPINNSGGSNNNNTDIVKRPLAA